MISPAIKAQALALEAESRHTHTTFSRRALSALLGASIAVCGTADVNKEHAPAPEQQYTISEIPPDAPLPTKTYVAAAPSTPSILEIANLLARTQISLDAEQSPSSVEDVKTYGIGPEGTRQKLRDIFTKQKEAADKYGLTIIDGTETIMELAENSIPAKSNMSLDEYIALANSYLSEHDIAVTDDNSPLYADKNSGQSPKTRIKDTYTSRFNIQMLVQTTAVQPKEFTELLGIHKYLLTTQVDKAGAYIHPDLDGPEGAAIVFNLSGMGTAVDVLHHEQYHRLDSILTGGYDAMSHDASFDKLAKDAPYGKIGPEPEKDEQDNRKLLATSMGWLTLEQLNDVENEIQDRVYNQRTDPDCAELAKTGEQQLATAGDRTVLTTNYSAENDIVERKAELGTYMLDGESYPRLLGDFTPHLTEQLIYLLARLHDYRPRLARYFIDVAERPRRDPRENRGLHGYLATICESK